MSPLSLLNESTGLLYRLDEDQGMSFEVWGVLRVVTINSEDIVRDIWIIEDAASVDTGRLP